MKFSNLVRQHWAALRALLVLTVITGIAYPLLIWLVAQFPGLHDKAERIDHRRSTESRSAAA